MASTADTYRLFYWPGMPGRGEFIRLLFVETGTPYEEVMKGKTPKEAMEIGYSQTGKSFAFPMLDHNGFQMSQTPVICRYLARHLAGGRLLPKSESEQVEAEIVQACVVDALAESEVYWHPIDRNAGYVAQKEAAQPFIEYFKTKRLPKWISFFERSLKSNLEKTGQLVFSGTDLSYVDLAVFFWMEGHKVECPEVFQKENTECLDKFFETIKSRPNIKAWLDSSDRAKFTMTGPCT